MSKSFMEESRRPWKLSDGEGDPPEDQLKLGCLQRIADATEKMAGNFTALQNAAKWEKERREKAEARMERMEHVIRGLRGALTKAKRKAARQ